jgi:uncharacterized damage-inducible protein DinB
MKINEFINRFEEIYSGNPWYGNSMSEVLKNISPQNAVKKINPHSHSIVELVYHIINWRNFTIKKLQGDKDYDVKQNDDNDWRILDYNNNNLWKESLTEFERTHNALMAELKNFREEALIEIVPTRKFSFEYLLGGLIQHDVYHLGQISLINSILKK